MQLQTAAKTVQPREKSGSIPAGGIAFPGPAINAFGNIDIIATYVGMRESNKVCVCNSLKPTEGRSKIAILRPEHGIEGAISGKCISVRDEFVPDFRHELEMAAK